MYNVNEIAYKYVIWLNLYVLCAIHSGLGYTSVNKFLNVMNIPSMSNKTFKNYEREMGPVIESVAKDSCEEACEEERQLMVSQAAELQKRLSVNMKLNSLRTK